MGLWWPSQTSVIYEHPRKATAQSSVQFSPQAVKQLLKDDFAQDGRNCGPMLSGSSFFALHYIPFSRIGCSAPFGLDSQFCL
jgi:hypothetical protein